MNKIMVARSASVLALVGALVLACSGRPMIGACQSERVCLEYYDGDDNTPSNVEGACKQLKSTFLKVGCPVAGRTAGCKDLGFEQNGYDHHTIEWYYDAPPAGFCMSSRLQRVSP